MGNGNTHLVPFPKSRSINQANQATSPKGLDFFFFFFGIHYRALRGAESHVALLTSMVLMCI